MFQHIKQRSYDLYILYIQLPRGEGLPENVQQKLRQRTDDVKEFNPFYEELFKEAMEAYTIYGRMESIVYLGSFFFLFLFFPTTDWNMNDLINIFVFDWERMMFVNQSKQFRFVLLTCPDSRFTNKSMVQTCEPKQIIWFVTGATHL